MNRIMTRSRRLSGAASRFLLLGVFGCSDAPANESGWAVTVDTLAGGVVHVVNSPPAEGIAPRWEIVPTVEIGTMSGSGPALFGQVKGVAPLPDGRIAVLDAQAQEVRIFAADGQHLRTFGGEGEGPGEFTGANGILVGTDGLIRVNDPRNARITLIHPESGYVSSTPIEVQMFGFLWSADIDSTTIYESSVAGAAPDRWSVLKVYDPEGVWSDTIRLSPVSFGSNTDAPGIYRWERGASSGLMAVPFWPGAVRVMSTDGYFWRKQADVNDYSFARATFAGDTTLVFESTRAPIPVSAAERDSAEARVIEVAGSVDLSRIPSEKPIVDAAFVDDQERLWVRVSSDSLTTYDVFGADGVYEGTAVTDLKIPSYWSPVIQGNQLYTLTTDEFDVPYVVRAEVRPIQPVRNGN